jgi:hypothetical protein
MADPPAQSSQWNVTLGDTSLVIEDEPAGSRQAGFTRFQMALGLRKRMQSGGG